MLCVHSLPPVCLYLIGDMEISPFCMEICHLKMDNSAAKKTQESCDRIAVAGVLCKRAN